MEISHTSTFETKINIKTESNQIDIYEKIISQEDFVTESISTKSSIESLPATVSQTLSPTITHNESPLEIARHFVGKWKLIAHDENFKEFMKLQGISFIQQKMALVAPFSKSVHLDILNSNGNHFIFHDITTIFGILKIEDIFTFNGSLESETLNQNVQNEKFTTRCWFESNSDNVRYYIDRTQDNGLNQLFTVETTRTNTPVIVNQEGIVDLKSERQKSFQENEQKEKRAMVASIKITKGNKSITTVDKWEFVH